MIKNISFIFALIIIIGCHKNNATVIQHNNTVDTIPTQNTYYMETETSYFTQEYLDKSISGSNIAIDLSNNIIIFDVTKADGFKIYTRKAFLDAYNRQGTKISGYYLEYKNYNIIIVTEEINGTEYVRDYLILEKEHPESVLQDGDVEINGEYFDHDIIVVIDSNWRMGGIPFTDDVNQAFKINWQTKKIEPVIYNTIRVHNRF